MWIVHPCKLSRITKMSTTRIFYDLWEYANPQTNSVQVNDQFREQYRPGELRAALRELEYLGIIRRGLPGKSWDVIWINPEIIRPWWLNGGDLADALESFKLGPTCLLNKIKAWDEADRVADGLREAAAEFERSHPYPGEMSGVAAGVIPGEIELPKPPQYPFPDD